MSLLTLCSSARLAEAVVFVGEVPNRYPLANVCGGGTGRGDACAILVCCDEEGNRRSRKSCHCASI